MILAYHKEVTKFLKGFLVLVFCLIFTEGAGVIGSLFTFPAIPTWYAGLTKPSFTPPDFLFGPVWTTLYFMMGLAAFFVFQKSWYARSVQQKKRVRSALFLFVLQLVLNVSWSVIFFGMHLPVLALVDICWLWFAIVITMYKFFRVSETAMFLLVPYLLWVTFTAVLNLGIVALN